MKKVPEDWKTASVIFQKGKEEDLRNYRPTGLTSNPGKVVHQIMLEAISKHTKGYESA